MITPEKIDSALARIKARKKESLYHNSVAIIAEVKENISQNPFDISKDLKRIASIYETADQEKQDFYEEIYASLKNAIGEHMEILLEDSTEIVGVA